MVVSKVRRRITNQVMNPGSDHRAHQQEQEQELELEQRHEQQDLAVPRTTTTTTSTTTSTVTPTGHARSQIQKTHKPRSKGVSAAVATIRLTKFSPILSTAKNCNWKLNGSGSKLLMLSSMFLGLL